MTLRDRVNPWRHGCGEQHCLSFGGCGTKNLFDVFCKAHVEHFIGFIEHHDAHTVESERLAGDVIERASRSRNHHVHTTRQRLQLSADRLPAVNRYDLCSEVMTIFVHSFGNLHGKLTSWNKHERDSFRMTLGLFNELQDWQGECRGLACAGCRLTNKIATVEEQRNRFSLDRGWFFVPEARQRFQKFRSQTKVSKRNGFCLGCRRDGVCVQGNKDKRHSRSRRMKR